MRPRGLLLVLLLVASAAHANPGLNPQASLDDARVAYGRGEYGVAVKTIRPLLYPSIELQNEESVVEAHKLLALSYFFLKKENEAEQEVVSLLVLRPTFELDPMIDSPVAVSFFKGVRERQEDRLHAIRERQRAEEERARREADRKREEARKLAERVYVEKRVAKNSRLVALVPFGVGQFQNGQRKKGIAFAAVEGVLGALSLSCWIATQTRFTGHLVPAGDVPLANSLQIVQLSAGAAFWAAVAWGIIDAQVKFVPEVVVRTKELPSKPTISIAPILAPGQFGLGLLGAF